MPPKKKEKPSESSNEKAMLEKMTGTYQITIELDGKKFKCVSPSINTHARFYGICRNKQIANAESYLATLLRAGISEQLAVDKYDEKVRDATPTEFEIFEVTNSIEGARYYFLETAKKNHPELTEEDVEKLVTEKTWEGVIRQINTLSPTKDMEKNVDRGATAKA